MNPKLRYLSADRIEDLIEAGYDLDDPDILDIIPPDELGCESNRNSESGEKGISVEGNDSDGVDLDEDGKELDEDGEGIDEDGSEFDEYSKEYPCWLMPKLKDTLDEKEVVYTTSNVDGVIEEGSCRKAKCRKKKGKKKVEDDDPNWEATDEEAIDSGEELIGTDDWDMGVQLSDSDGDGVHVRRSGRVKVFDTVEDLRNVELKLGSRFKNVDIFRGVLKHYAADKSFDYYFTKNEPTRVVVVCKEDDCSFRLWCSRVQGSTDMEIKTFIGEHSCQKAIVNTKLTYDWIAKRYASVIKKNPGMQTEVFQRQVHEDLGVGIGRHTAYRALRRARATAEGDLADQYARLHSYAAVITRTNPGSRCKLIVEHHANPGESQTTPRFLRLYLRFTAQKDGFLAGCRPIVGLDGCHLKGYYGGQVLAVVAWDANEGMFPIAIAVVEQENKSSWKWFLEELFDDYGGDEKRAWVFISDKQKGLVEVFNESYPIIEHRYCMRHLYDNWYSQFKSEELKSFLWNCAKATSDAMFEREMEKMKEESEEAHTWLRQRHPRSWCKAFFSTRAKNACQTNSMSECFNSWIKSGRHLPILDFCEFIRRKLMGRFFSRKQKLNGYKGLICPDVRLMVEYNREDARHCFVLPSGDGLFEVDEKGNTFTVDLRERACSCLDFQLSGIPCNHAVACILQKKDNPESYVHHYYHCNTFRVIYAGRINQVPGKREWPTINLPVIQPPIIRKPPGRPRKNRKKAASEKVNPNRVSRLHLEVTCGKCKQKGHNRRTCSAKDYGETTSQRKLRVRKAASVGEGSQSSEVKDKNVGQGTKRKAEDLNVKREAARKKLEKKKIKQAARKLAQRNAKGKKSVQEPVPDEEVSQARVECTPEEIEAKRLQAIQRQQARAQKASHEAQTSEHATSQDASFEAPTCQPWVPGVHRPKRQKLQIIRRVLRQENKQSPDPIMQIQSEEIVTIPKVGLAETKLINSRNHEWEFQQLLTQENHNGKGKGKGRIDAGASRFSQEARFSKTPRGVMAASSQPEIRSPPPSPSGPHSQP